MDWSSLISQVVDKGGDVAGKYFESKTPAATYNTYEQKDNTLLYVGIIAIVAVLGLTILKKK